MWGWVKKAAKKVWNGVKRAAKVVVHVAAGIASVVINLGKSGLSALSLVLEGGLALFGITPRKKLRLRVLILSDNNGPVANRSGVERVVQIAQEVFKKRANVTLIGANGQEIVQESPEPAPAYALNPPCANFPKHVAGIFSGALGIAIESPVPSAEHLLDTALR